MLGAMTGGKHLTAMVQAPNGKTYFVQEKMPIGDRKGIIRKITDTEIFVRERVVNVLGIEETVNSTIELPSDSKTGRETNHFPKRAGNMLKKRSPIFIREFGFGRSYDRLGIDRDVDRFQIGSGYERRDRYSIRCTD